MISTYKKIKYILGKKAENNLKVMVLLNSFNFIFEFLSISSLPIFASALIDPNFTREKITNILNLNFLNAYSNQELLTILGIIVIVLFLIKNIYLFLLTVYQANYFKKIKKKLSNDIFSQYINQKYENFIDENSSVLIRNLTSQIQSVYGFLHNIMLFYRELLAVFVLFLILLIVSVKFTIILCVIFSLISISYQFLIKPHVMASSVKNQKIDAKMIKILNESYGSIKEIKIGLQEKKINELFNVNVNIFENNLRYFYILDKCPKILLEFVVLVLLVIVSFYLSKTNQSSLDYLPQIAMVIILSFRFVPAFQAMNISLTYLKIYRPAVELLFNKKNELGKNSNIDESKETLRYINKNLEKNCILKMSNISYKYPNRENFTIKNFNFTLNEGDKLGITGETGSGKSTLIYLMMSLIKPTNGEIHFNSLKKFNNIGTWLNCISYVPQSPFLYDSSIKENISFSFDTKQNEIDINKIENLVDLTLLRKKIKSLPNGLNSKVGDNAIQLSGGEKQRIAIARSLYKKFDVLFMDEFTSSLDSLTEQSIISNLLNKYPNKTFIIISHKKSTLKMCNKIINLNDVNGY
mgnify:CR=1 FL=1|tara:strand:- start:192 stop:1934 length:1743 start_codon:yes stop_codon:yes gene_type:complete